MPWFEWTQADLPCFFSGSRATENAAFLRQCLGEAFIARRSRAHPLLKLWDETTAQPFLQLNALAEDIRLLASKQGFSTVLRDLRSIEMHESAKHTIHTAALFERARAGSLLSFIEARNDTVPDYIVNIANRAVAVEAKLVVTSVVQEQFGKVAMREIERCKKLIEGRAQSYFVVVVAKDATMPPRPGVVADAIAKLPEAHGEYNGEFGDFKVWAQVSEESESFAEHREIHFLAPVHDKDYLRLKGPVKKASKQLRALPGVEKSGILALGLARQQQPHAVTAILANEMSQGNYSGVGAALLIKQGTHLGMPRRSVVDALETRRNPWATSPINESIPLRSIDLAVNLGDAEPPDLDKPAYVCATVEGRVKQVHRGAGLFLRRLDRIPRGLL